MPESILHEEIQNQPDVIEKLIRDQKNNIENIVDSIKNRFSYIYIAARGSSDNAARYAQYLFGIRNQIAVGLATPSIFTLYKQRPNLKNALVIGISQSGQSPDIVSVLENARNQGCPTIAITNDEQAPITHTADFVVNLNAGTEHAIAATKTYTSSLTALAMISELMRDDSDDFFNLKRLPAWMKTIIRTTENVLPRVERYRYMEQCCVLGRGFNYSTSFEISLKIKEINRIISEPYSTADFKHGPISTVHPGFPVFVIATPGPTYDDTMHLIADLKQRGAELILVSNEYIESVDPVLSFLAPTEVPEYLSPITSVIPGQLFAMQLAIERGLDPDFPYGLLKVTQTY